MIVALAAEAAKHAYARGNAESYPSLSTGIWASARAKNAGIVLVHGEFVRAYEGELARLRGAQ
jgi:hypothetical protein